MSTSKAVSITCFFIYIWAIFSYFFACLRTFDVKPHILDNVSNNSGYWSSTHPENIVVACWFISSMTWPNYFSDIYLPHSVQPLMLVLRGHSLGHAERYSVVKFGGTLLVSLLGFSVVSFWGYHTWLLTSPLTASLVLNCFQKYARHKLFHSLIQLNPALFTEGGL